MRRIQVVKPAKVLGVTGHRPDKFGVPHECDNLTDYPFFVNAMLKFKRLVEWYKPDLVITGMALGFDQWVAMACPALGVPYAAYVPFKGQESKWPEQAQKVYRELLACAAYEEVISDGGYAVWKMHARNKAIVDDCTYLGGAYDGSPGGTEQCVRYAIRTDRELTILDPREPYVAECGMVVQSAGRVVA